MSEQWIAESLRQMFPAMQVRVREGQVTFSLPSMKGSVREFARQEHPTMVQVGLEFQVFLERFPQSAPLKEHITEFGQDAQEAIHEACRNWRNSVYEVLWQCTENMEPEYQVFSLNAEFGLFRSWKVYVGTPQVRAPSPEARAAVLSHFHSQPWVELVNQRAIPADFTEFGVYDWRLVMHSMEGNEPFAECLLNGEPWELGTEAVLDHTLRPRGPFKLFKVHFIFIPEEQRVLQAGEMRNLIHQMQARRRQWWQFWRRD